MNKKVLIISTSLRENSNSEILADEFMKGAKAANNSVEKISLKDKKIEFCKGCLSCQRTLKCVINDDAVEIAEKMKEADVVVWATPVYYYEMSGQMKTLIDRLNPLFSSAYKFGDIYLIATAADCSEVAINGTINGLEGWIMCLSRTNLKGVLKGVGLTDPNDVKSYEKYLKQAYDMGKNV